MYPGLSAKGDIQAGRRHSDNRPVSEKWHNQFIDNWDLSARRAAAIARHLIWGYGLKPENISVTGRAFVEPVADNATEEGRAKNPRAQRPSAQRLHTRPRHRGGPQCGNRNSLTLGPFCGTKVTGIGERALSLFLWG